MRRRSILLSNFAFFGSFVVFASLPATARAESKWTLTTADFASRQVELVSIDASGARVSDSTGAGGTAREVTWDDFLSLQRQGDEAPVSSPSPATQPAAESFVVYLAGGDQLRGSPEKLDGESLTWLAPSLGQMKLPLKEVIGLDRPGRPAPRAGEKRAQDVVMLSNGDSVRGILSGLSDGTITMQSGGGNVPVPLSSVTSIRLAGAPGAASTGLAAARAIRIRLVGDSIITAPSVHTRDGVLVLVPRDAAAGPARQIPLSSVIGIEQLNGPVSWLSSRVPSENIQTPLLDTTRPARMDRAVDGGPIRFGQQVFAHGIGVAPYSRLTFPLDPSQGYKSFRTRYAIDGNGSYADVTVRIRLDGRVVHERKDLTAGEISPVITVPLGNARSLTLEVDYGANLGVQDRFNWIEPALVRQ